METVPPEWNFNQVVDLFFKVHVVFHIKFEVNIRPAMIFFAAFLYEFKRSEFAPTQSMTNLNNRVNAATVPMTSNNLHV